MIHSENRQIQTLADIIGSKTPLLPPDELDQDFKWLLGCITDAPPGQIYATLSQIKADEPDMRHVIDRIIAAIPGQRRDYLSLDQIETPPTEFMWEGWLPRGDMTLLVAAPGVGKTYFMLDLFRRIIHQLSAPDDAPLELPPGANNRVILVDAENYLPAIKERVSAWGMQLNQVYPMEKPVRGLIDLTDTHYQNELTDMVDALRPAVVAIDSLSRVNSRGENNIEDVRGVLDFLAEIPKLFGCSLLLVHHLRKRNSRQQYKPVTIDDIRGTGDLIAAARSVIAIDPIQSNKNARRVSNIKINEGEKPNPLGFQLVPLETQPRIARLDYQELSALAPKAPSKVDECAEWLEAILQDGPMPMRELLREATGLGFNINNLQTARDSLGDAIADTLGPRRRGNEWILREQMSDDLPF